ncbi:MAG: hypothetical protein A3F84_06800 [Candidatus Handelsmanbacteria bacterium RIFCSPLOWO2_12_FULL_64_10]|uniref:Peptidase C45 hydrolase domain-containing protein n=1 Tax=Handelsmanbacteria sp. (strain RIFCSPLOWO2_12_FULL_64_10) TaxID=1817868 RepID=A0A1F6CTZ9_HANXR|nr:MAG: hypothetical protein A3F84_06800 [Candidatus Handelsmanbacteria bacterium RIFCSPLOWO2_12_FULL_64_10]
MIPEFEVTGSPHERGVQTGRRFRERIRNTLPRPSQRPEHQPRQTAILQALYDYLGKTFPEILEETRGIAEGAGVSAEDAFLKSAYNAIGPAVGAACSSVAFTRSDVGPLLGKTDDGVCRSEPNPGRGDGLAILTIRPEKGHDVLCMNEVGTLWSECGINAKGLCVGTSSGHPTMPGQDGRGVPQHIIPRLLLLRCATVPEAVDLLRSTPLTGKGVNVVLADEEGNAAATENTGSMNGVRGPENGVVFSTNHYYAPEMLAVWPKWDPGFISTRYFQNSVNRVVHLYGRFRERSPALTFQEMKETLMDEHVPGGLCQRPDRNDARMATNFATLFVSRKREMWLNEGFPSLDQFRRYGLT